MHRSDAFITNHVPDAHLKMHAHAQDIRYQWPLGANRNVFPQCLFDFCDEGVHCLIGLLMCCLVCGVE